MSLSPHNPQLLKKAIKRKQKQKERSARKWEERKEALDAAGRERQEKREANLKKRKAGPSAAAEASSKDEKEGAKVRALIDKWFMGWGALYVKQSHGVLTTHIYITDPLFYARYMYRSSGARASRGSATGTSSSTAAGRAAAAAAAARGPTDPRRRASPSTTSSSGDPFFSCGRKID